MARVDYIVGEDGQTWPDFWDADYACFDWGQPFPAGVVHRFSPPDHERVAAVAVTAVPLFNISSVDDVLAHMQRVREATSA